MNVIYNWAIESALDIREIIISSENLEKPEDYRNIIITLGKEGIIPGEFARRFSEAAKFRNILVHMYIKVDPAVISQILRTIWMILMNIRGILRGFWIRLIRQLHKKK